MRAYERLFNDATHSAFDSSAEYVLIGIIRNYIAHANNAISRSQIGLGGNKVWVSKYELANDFNLPRTKQQVVARQEEYIDLEQVADKSLERIREVNEELLNYQLDEEIIEAAATINFSSKKIHGSGIQAEAWAICHCTEIKMVSDINQSITMTRLGDEEGQHGALKEQELPRKILSFSLNYDFLNWKGYEAVTIYLLQLWEKGYWREIRAKYYPN